MAFEFPYSFVAGGVARAAEVMANFNALKTLVNGGLNRENFNTGAFPQVLSYPGGDKGALAKNNALLDGGEVAFSLAEKSRVIFLYDLDASCATFTKAEQNTYVGATLMVDGGALGTVKTGVASFPFLGEGGDVAVTNGGLSRSIAATLAAGTHHASLLSVVNLCSNWHFYGTNLTMLIVPAP